MVRKMVVNAADIEEVRIAALDDGRLAEFDIETRGTVKNKGNIYKARVVAVEPALNAAFVDYGAEKQGFLTAGDVDPRLAKNTPEGKHPTIEELLKPNQAILVQITKDEVDKKGAVLTTYLSLAGRYIVLMPESASQGVSRKIDDERERRAMRHIVEQLRVPKGMGVILRTAGRDRSGSDLKRDLNVLLGLWENIRKESNRLKAPALIFQEQDVIIRALRDYFSPEVDEIILDCDEAYDRASEYMHLVMPRHASVLTRYVERRPIFHHYRIEEQLEALYTPHVVLPSGGSIVIEQAEALVAIDVNSGKQKASGHEETATQTNIEAAREVARQLRLRDLGGIIVIDFIDMSQRRNQTKVESVLREAMNDDKARVKVGRVSRNGTVELTRQRIRSALAKSVFRICSVCHGTGRILNPHSHAVAALRRLTDRSSRCDLASAKIRIEPEAGNVMRTAKWSAVTALEERYGISVEVIPDQAMSPGQDDFTFVTNPDAEAVEMEAPNFGPVDLPDDIRAELEAEWAAFAAEDAADDFQLESTDEPDADDDSPRQKSSRRKRGRSKAGKSRDPLALPGFEMVDPASLGLKGTKSGSGSGSGSDSDDDASSTGKKRGRRGGRRRRRGGADRAVEPQANAVRKSEAELEAEDAAAELAKPRKRGFFAWLFGMG